MNCPKCGAPADAPGANFCEECGAALAPAAETALPPAAASPAAAGCPNCGAGPEAIEAGFCGQCGLEQRVPVARDHLEITPSPRLAGVTDRGFRHHRNEDFLAAADAGETCVLVVCDGVSDTPDSDAASAAAAPIICESLLAAGPGDDAAHAMRVALARAQTAVKAFASPRAPDDAPASTVVAALVHGREVTLGWLGDSRAYFFPAGNGGAGSRLLTKDHSWLNDVVDAGQLTLAEARGRRGAHTITRSLGGPPADPTKGDDEPTLAAVSLPGPGWLLLCSDGLWNYAEEPPELLAHLRPGDDALAFARRLVEHARACGGRDNITAVVLSV